MKEEKKGNELRQITGEKSLKSRETSKDVCKKRDV